MGVDFYSCEQCGYNFPDCGNYFSCDTCSAHFCSTECGVCKTEEVEHIDDDYEERTTCVLCRLEDATPLSLLHALYTHFSLTHEQALEIYRKQERGNGS